MSLRSRLLLDAAEWESRGMVRVAAALRKSALEVGEG